MTYRLPAFKLPVEPFKGPRRPSDDEHVRKTPCSRPPTMVFTQLTTRTGVNVKEAFVRLGALIFGDSSRSILPFVPRPVRYLLLLLLLVNARSFPLTWHCELQIVKQFSLIIDLVQSDRMFSPVARLRFKWWSLKLTLSSAQSKEKWLDSRQPIGLNPFSAAVYTPYSSWASPDESDYNMHLSNSSYAKTLDAVRLNCALEYFLAFFRDGGWIALGGTHFNFIREIPIGAHYDVRSSFGAWDGKWVRRVVSFRSLDTLTVHIFFCSCTSSHGLSASRRERRLRRTRRRNGCWTPSQAFEKLRHLPPAVKPGYLHL